MKDEEKLAFIVRVILDDSSLLKQVDQDLKITQTGGEEFVLKMVKLFEDRGLDEFVSGLYMLYDPYIFQKFIKILRDRPREDLPANLFRNVLMLLGIAAGLGSSFLIIFLFTYFWPEKKIPYLGIIVLCAIVGSIMSKYLRAQQIIATFLIILMFVAWILMAA